MTCRDGEVAEVQIDIGVGFERADDLKVCGVTAVQREFHVKGCANPELPFFPEGAQRCLAIAAVDVMASFGKLLRSEKRIVLKVHE